MTDVGRTLKGLGPAVMIAVRPLQREERARLDRIAERSTKKREENRKESSGPRSWDRRRGHEPSGGGARGLRAASAQGALSGSGGRSKSPPYLKPSVAEAARLEARARAESSVIQSTNGRIWEIVPFREDLPASVPEVFQQSR